MTTERWRQVEEIFHAALSRDESERAAFLAHACAGDLALRRDVEVLLAQQTSGFLEGPAVAAVGETISDPGDSLLTGRRLGSYQVYERIGVGGMGEVYRARDTKLGRDVAIKILPRLFTSDPDRLARFEREARMLASLNHPHIAAIYGLEETATGNALVLELVDGPTLSDRIAKGAFPLDEALPIARQIAEALEFAHERGIVHRDLKPANIKLTPNGSVKVLDFGLAKATELTTSGASVSKSPTITTPVMTAGGVILGTAPYMSPEQALGKTVDKRADVWAFGCVLFEMLTSRRAFSGNGVTDVLAAVIRDAPAFDALPPETPPLIRRLLRRCLEKDPARRLDSMRAVRLDIDEVIEEGRRIIATSGSPFVAGREMGNRRRIRLSVAAVSIATFLGGAYTLGRRSSPTAPAAPTYVEVTLTPAQSLGPALMFQRPSRPSFRVTADGRQIVFAGVVGSTTQLFVRSIGSRQAIPIAGTSGAETPFLSADGQWIGFLADGVIRRVAVAGGPVVAIADLREGGQGATSTLVPPGTDFFGASWGEDGTIVFGRYSDGLWQVSAAGGTPTRLTTSTGEVFAHRLPHHLPDRRGLLLTMAGERSRVAVLARGATEPRVLVESATDGRYITTGHIVFTREGLLMAVPFDLDRLAATAEPFALEDDVMEADGSGSPGANSGAAQFDVTPSGTLVFAPGGTYPPQPSRLVWVDRLGQVQPIHTAAGAFIRPRLSPDGRRVAVTYASPSRRDPSGIYIADLARGLLTRLTTTSEWGPLWSADGSQIYFKVDNGLGRIRADGSSAIERLHEVTAYPHSISPEGSLLLFQSGSRETGADIWLMPLGADRTPRPLLRSPANEAWAEISPNGQWLAYGSDSSGKYEVYVQPFPGLGPRQQVSFEGGHSPLWGRSGRELFFLSNDNLTRAPQLHVVDVTSGPSFTATKPRELFSGRFAWTGGPTAYDVSMDDKRFLMVEYLEPEKQPVTRLRLVLNWFEELRRAERMNK